MEIKTNVGTFGDFKDIEAYMRLESHSEVDIYAIRALMTTWEHLTGRYSYDEIRQIINTEGVLE
jgi:hypothetical protein